MPAHYDDTTNETQEYQQFIEKFKPKKTTDDCYTPQEIYEAIRDWAVAEYHLEGRPIIRPFYPNGDYQHEEYPANCVVIDNPPFSILSAICTWYTQHNIDYFLFAPFLMLFSTNSGKSNYIIANCTIVYENGAKVNTSFVTNLGEYKIRTAPELAKTVNSISVKSAVNLPKYRYPSCVVSAAILGTIANVDFRVKPEQVHFIRSLASQRQKGKAIYGGGFLVTQAVAAEAEKARAEAEKARAEAEKARAVVWRLSDEEKQIVADLCYKSGEPTPTFPQEKENEEQFSQLTF